MQKAHNGAHKYRRAIIGKKDDWPIYRCIIVRCSHHLPEAAMLGQSFTCGSCEEEDIVRDKEDLLTRTPLKCRKCRRQPEIDVEKILEVVQKVIKNGV